VCGAVLAYAPVLSSWLIEISIIKLKQKSYEVFGIYSIKHFGCILPE
jgi:hypothetical protein